MKIDENVLAVLSTMRIEGQVAFITAGQLDRKLYVAVNKVLEELGGVWNRKAKGHIFLAGVSVEDLLDSIIVSGEITTRQDLGFFPTPPDIAKRLVAAADVQPGMTVLEPSAGEGALIDALPDGVLVVAVEVDERRAKKFLNRHPRLYAAVFADFLTTTPSTKTSLGYQIVTVEMVDRVIMNPPFAWQQDIDHVRHAFKFLKPGGRLAAIMSAGTRFRENAKACDFREFLRDHNGTMVDLPVGAFEVSGTSVRTVLVTMDR